MTIKSLRSDRRGEYMSQVFLDHLKEHGIITHRTPPYTPQHNGVSERRDRILLDMVRSMMSQTTLSKSFWDYALETNVAKIRLGGTRPPSEHLAIFAALLETAARVLNMVPTKKDTKRKQWDSFYNPSENKVFVARNAEFFKNDLIDLNASGSVEDLELTQEEDTNPSLNTSLDHEEDDQEINKPQSDINPIRKSFRTRRTLDRMCLCIDSKAHELGDLSKPANSKAALLDIESKKWLDTMNVEMQSMKDNDVWVLVELPPNAKTVGSKWLFKKKTDIDGAVYIIKAHLVAKGFTQTYRVDYEETFSPISDIRAIRILIAIAAYYDYEIWINYYDVRCTRPDVAFAQNITSRFQQNPGEEHWTAVKNILKYLRNTKYMFLVYGGNMERELKVSCYTDVGYLTDADDLKSQTRYVFILNGGTVWKSTKQSIFATSYIDVEYIAVFDASNEAVWIHRFISGLGIVPTIEEPISMYCDNTEAIALVKDDGVTKDARHF
nr:hypothetical protein [Tanacetum cinerariifolium]